MMGLIMIGVILAGIVLRGWALSTLWAWFLVPIGVTAIGINTALGISVIVGLFTTHLHQESVKTDKKSIADACATIVTKAIGSPLAALLVGWIILQFA